MNRKGILAIAVVSIVIIATLFYMLLIVPEEKPPAEGNVLVIAAIPFLENPVLDVHKPTWVEVEQALPQLKEVGVNAIFFWGPYVHRFPERGETIIVLSKDGYIELEIEPAAHIRNYTRPDPSRGTEHEFLNVVKKAHELGLKVLGQLQVTLATPGDFIYDRHPEWLLQSIYGAPAIHWPWAMCPYGFKVNKAHPELINFVVNTVLPYWINVWGFDGVYLDSPGMAYCDLHIAKLCELYGCAPGCEPLTPVDGYYSPEPLAKAFRKKMDELMAETGRELMFPAEETIKTWHDIPEEFVISACNGDFWKWRWDTRVNRSMGSYFDWVMDYQFRSLLKAVYDNSITSEQYVNLLLMIDHKLNGRYTKLARFINIWVDATPYIPLLEPNVAECFITLWGTATGNILFIGSYLLPPWSEVMERLFGYDGELLKELFSKVISIKKQYGALRSGNIENALLKPNIKGLIAYNRWDERESITVIVNPTPNHLTASVKTRFSENADVMDLLSGEHFKVKSSSGELTVHMPAYSARILVKGQNYMILSFQGKAVNSMFMAVPSPSKRAFIKKLNNLEQGSQSEVKMQLAWKS